MVPQLGGDLQRLLLLGEDEARYGSFRLEGLAGGRAACSLSVGSDPATPARVHKGNRQVPNEDALLVIDDGDRALLAVADAHHGTAASHALLRELDRCLDGIPGSPAGLARTLRSAGLKAAAPTDASATTLLAAVLRRDRAAGFGYCFGDSACALVGAARSGGFLGRSNGTFVVPGFADSLAPERASFFDFDAPPGGLLLAFTDGLHGCHYGHPESSLGAAQLRAAFAEVGPRAEEYVRRITTWALEGLEGHPGGQDNLALIAVTT